MPVIAEVMRREPLVTAPPEASLREAARLMAEHNVGSVLVSRDGRLLGIFTERDLARKVAENLDLDAERLGDHMTRDPLVARPSESLVAVAHKMIAHGIRHVPVVDDAGRLIGIVSIRDILRRIIGEHEFP